MGIQINRQEITVVGTWQETVGGDLFRIETKDAYPLEHDTLVDQAAEEQEKDFRPELSSHVENFEQYDTVILGASDIIRTS